MEDKISVIKNQSFISKIFKRVNFLKILRDKNQLESIDKKNNIIIETLKSSKNDFIDFKVSTMDATKIDLYYQAKDYPDKKIVIAYGDIDGLKEANMKYKMETKNSINTYNEEEIVDKQIAEVTYQLKELCQKLDCKYYIGKPEHGDEILIGLVGISEEQYKEFKKSSNQIKTKDFTISLGMADNIEKGIEETIKFAEKEMKQIKESKKQSTKAQDIFVPKDEKNPEKISLGLQECEKYLKELIEYSISILRADNLSNKQKNTLKGNFIKSLEVPEKQKNSIKQQMAKREEKNKEELDLIFTIIPKLEEELKEEYKDKDVTEEFIRNSVKSKILSEHPVMGKRERYFREIQMKQNSIKTVDIEKYTVTDIDISGIKFINDIYGHGETDREVNQIMIKAEQIVKDLGLKQAYTFGKGISSYTILFENASDEQMIEFKKQIQEINTNMNVNTDFRKLEISDTDKKLLKLKQLFPEYLLSQMVKETSNKNKNEIENIKKERKVEPSIFMTSQVIRFTETNIVKEYMEVTGKSLEEILNNILDEVLEIDTNEEDIMQKEEKIIEDKEK